MATMTAIATFAGAVAYALALTGGESRFFAAAFAIVAMCAAIFIGV